MWRWSGERSSTIASIVGKPAIERAASVLHRAGRDGVDADVLLAEVPGEVADARVESRLGDAHHVVVRDCALAAEVGHGHDRAAAGGLHQGLGGARRRDERVGADVERHPEALARGVCEAAFEILGGGEGDRVDEEVELAAEGLADLGEDPGDLLVGADVARGDERARDRLRELADVALDPLALEGERELRAAVGEPLRDRPGDRALVGDAEHEAALSLEGHAATLAGARLLSRQDARRGRHGSIVGDRRGALPGAPARRLACGRALAARGTGRRRARGLRRRRPGDGRGGRGARARAAPADRSAREQRGDRGTRGVPRAPRRS